MSQRIGQLMHGLLTLLLVSGCAQTPSESPDSLLSPLALADDSVVLEIVSVRFPFNDAEINGPLWTEIDEQQIPHPLRHRLASNGFRVGILGGRLPLRLEQLLNLKEEASGPQLQQQVVDLENEPLVRGRHLRIRGGRRTHIIATGEKTRHAQLAVLTRGDDGQVGGRTFPKAMGIFALKAFPQGDGRVRLQLVPEIEHGENQKRFVASDGMLKVEFGPPHEVFDPLRTELDLSPGQTLVLGCLPQLTGSLGYHYFTDDMSGTLEQKMVLIRLVQTQYDDRFTFDDLLTGTPPKDDL